MVIPQWRAGCIRVTHPCAGRRQIKQALSPMPLDLHVLGLSLAFILSQDQTLRCFYVISTFVLIILARYAYQKALGFYFTWNKFFFLWRDASAVPSVLFPLCFLLSFVLVYRNYFNVLFYFHFARPLPCFFPKASAKLQPFSELTNYLQLFLLHFFWHFC